MSDTQIERTEPINKPSYLHIPGHPRVPEQGPAVPHGPSYLFVHRETFYPECGSGLASKLQLQGQILPVRRSDLHLLAHSLK